jgi:hypothetical protein
MLLRLCLVAVVITLTGDMALAYCSKPSAPSCATRYGSFDDEDEFESCKRRMPSYRSDVESYLSCLKSDSDEAIREYNDAVE